MTAPSVRSTTADTSITPGLDWARAHAFRALTGYSMKRALGSKKRWTAKVVPVILYAAVALLVIIPLGIQAFIDSAQILQYWDYFSVAWLILGVFVATDRPGNAL